MSRNGRVWELEAFRNGLKDVLKRSHSEAVWESQNGRGLGC